MSAKGKVTVTSLLRVWDSVRMPDENSKKQEVSAAKTEVLFCGMIGKYAVIPEKTADTVLKNTANPQIRNEVLADSEIASVTISVAVRRSAFFDASNGLGFGNSRGITVCFCGVSAEIAMDEIRQDSHSFTPVTVLPSIVSPTAATVKPIPGFEQRGSARSASAFVHCSSL